MSIAAQNKFLRNRVFDDFRDVPPTMWRWRYFTPSELKCKGTNSLMVHPASLDKLDLLRERLGYPLYATSAFRSDLHNRRVGGAKKSEHLKAKAFDIQMHNVPDRAEFEDEARAVGFTGFGFYPQYNFIHIDTGRAREWGRRW